MGQRDPRRPGVVFLHRTGLRAPGRAEGRAEVQGDHYEHAEGFASGELKHGPLALVTSDATIYALLTGERGEKTRKNADEARTRGARIVAVAPAGTEVDDLADGILRVPDMHPDLAGLLANVQLQPIAYRAAYDLGREIDKPRNLAESVTVE